jgi:hypothetical protein
MLYTAHCSIVAPEENFEYAKFSALLEAATPEIAEESLKVLARESEILCSLAPPFKIYLDYLLEVPSLPASGAVTYYEQIYLNVEKRAIGEIVVSMYDDPINEIKRIGESHILLTRS